jgi:hypothetical protein
MSAKYKSARLWQVCRRLTTLSRGVGFYDFFLHGQTFIGAAYAEPAADVRGDIDYVRSQAA